MVDSFLVAALLVTVSVCIWSEQDIFYITEWNKYQHPLLSYHFSSLYNLIGVASFVELSKTCCHLQEHIKWQKIDNR